MRLINLCISVYTYSPHRSPPPQANICLASSSKYYPEQLCQRCLSPYPQANSYSPPLENRAIKTDESFPAVFPITDNDYLVLKCIIIWLVDVFISQKLQFWANSSISAVITASLGIVNQQCADKLYDFNSFLIFCALTLMRSRYDYISIIVHCN